DQLISTPTVQLFNYSNSAFQNAAAVNGDDLVFVITRYTVCTSSTVQNKVFAFRASTGTLAWTFNATNFYSMDFGAEGCSLDYTNNRIYCGTNLPSLSQNTLW